jgi:polyisoprenyl-teichoic acid--peptidoglycan teichoic acid transferase
VTWYPEDDERGEDEHPGREPFDPSAGDTGEHESFGETEEHQQPFGETEEHQQPFGETEDFEAGADDETDDADDAEPVGPDTELEQIISAETQEWDGIESAGAAKADEDEDEPPDREPDHDDAEKTLVASAGSAVTSGFKAVGSGVKAVGRRARFPIWARFLVAAVIIVASVGTATAASLLNYIEDIGERIKPLPGVDDKLDAVVSGEPQTIMILGSDKRPEEKADKSFRGLSDTTMLLRIDPDRDALALFSLPRDLRVEIPGVGTDKLNAAYAYGGPELTLETVQQLTRTPATPDGLEINHVVNIDFEGFARAVNEIDCVYVDVDRRYFNQNNAFDGEDDYEEIDVQPGYQALCGFDALDYARYRHTDNDVVRAARQQDFLREARQKVPPEVLFAERKDLIDIFTEHTSSDIRDAGEMLEVLKLFIDARDAPIKQVKFEGTLGPSYVDTTPQEINRAVTQFLGLEDTPGARASTSAPENPDRVGTPDVAPDQAKLKKDATPEKGGGGEGADLVNTSYGKKLAQSIRNRKVKLPVYYPTVLESGSDYAQKPRVYKVNGTGEGSPPDSERAAYKWVFSRPELGEYYGFMATRWQDPPILNNPSDEREIGDRTYKFFYDGDRVRMIAWQTDEGSFWVSNSLAQSLSDREMLEIAKGMAELPRRGQSQD